MKQHMFEETKSDIKWYAVKGVSNLLRLWRKRHEEILKHKSSIPESSIKQRMIKKIETMLEYWKT